MRDTLVLLRLEHGNLSKLLRLIEDQAAVTEGGAQMDEELLRLASEYFSDYPDRCHHPKEDLVYKLLSQRSPDSCAGFRDLIADHRRLHELAEAFGSAVRRMREEPQAAQPGVRQAIVEFTEHYRRHMRDEEERFFRVAEEQLTRADWDTLDFIVFEQDDPLFDHVVEKRFSALRERIEALARQEKERQSVVDAANGLRALSGIESFNELMNSEGLPFRLTRFPQGGYGLGHDRELLLYVPECSTAQAAWCAYCFLRGRGWPWTRRDSSANS